MNNQESYPKHDPPLPLYFNGAYDPERDNMTSPPIEDFDPNETYSWTPIAGGKGWGNPSGAASGSSSSSDEAASSSGNTAGTQGGGQSGGTVLVRPSKPVSGHSGTRNGSEEADGANGSAGGGTTLVTPSNVVAEKSGAKKVSEEDDCDDDS